MKLLIFLLALFALPCRAVSFSDIPIQSIDTTFDICWDGLDHARIVMLCQPAARNNLAIVQGAGVPAITFLFALMNCCLYDVP